MSWIITGTEKYETDPYRSQVSLLLHGDGANGSTTIVDSSPTPKTVTAVGNAQISTAQSKFGGASIAFDGSGDYLDLSASSNFNFGTGNYTVEGWLYQSNVSTDIIADFRVGQGQSIGIYSGISSNFRLAIANNTAVILTSSISFLINTWTHWAVCREDSTVRIFIGGTLAGSVTDSRNYTNSSCRIGANLVAGQGFNGYIDDLRITKGVARYTSNFTPPTAPFPDI